MATRYILTKEEPTLYKKSRPVKKFDERLHQLLDDMAETLLESVNAFIREEKESGRIDELAEKYIYSPAGEPDENAA